MSVAEEIVDPPSQLGTTGDGPDSAGHQTRHPRRTLFGVEIDAVTNAEAAGLLLRWAKEPLTGGCRYVVTPNVNHVVRLSDDLAFRQAYENAALVVADGWPLVASSKLLGRPLPERVAGSDLVPAVLAEGLEDRPLRAFLLGGKPGVPERAAERIAERWPHVEVVGALSPSFEFVEDQAEQDRVIDAINAVEPDFLVVGLGAPKQERWLSDNYQRLAARTAVAGGATIDFLAGEQTRAPRWVQAASLEWVFRIGTNPRRLAGRYLHDGLRFPLILARQALSQLNGTRDDE